MPNYSWKGKGKAGKIQEGVIAADSKEAVVAMLRRQQILVTAVTEKGKEIALPKFGGGVKQKEIAIFTRQFSVMIDAGLPLVQCLEILGSQQKNQVFNDLFCNMIAAGEAGGILDTILQRMSTYIEKRVKLQAAVRSAMIYPAAVVTIAVGVVIVILWKVIPTFAALFEGLGAQLPLPTRITIAVSRFLGRYMWLLTLLAIAGAFGLYQYHKTYKGKRQLD